MHSLLLLQVVVRLRPSAEGAASLPCLSGVPDKKGLVISRVSPETAQQWPCVAPHHRGFVQNPKDDSAPQKHYFDHVFDQSSPQKQVYQDVRAKDSAYFSSVSEHCMQVAMSMIDHVLNGYNACCFAYGQTGSGKTYT